MRSWRVIDTGARHPAMNMAIDEALLQGYLHHDSPPTLRLYRWRPCGISIGYAQDPAAALDAGACRRAGVPVVRRVTGGGAIMHDRELTYSLVCSKEDLRIPARIVSSYRIIASFLTSFYRSLGLAASFACEAAFPRGGERLGEPSCLCFAAKEKYDITIGGRKIGGSAQKRSGGAIFQHGSIPLAIDRKGLRNLMADPAMAGSLAGAVSLEELLGALPDARELAARLVESFQRTFGVSMEAGRLNDTEQVICDDLRCRKYGHEDWNLHRNADVCNDQTVMA